MFAYVWPIALVVLSNTVYQICAKSVPGLEAGWLFAYKAGWQVSTGFIVQSAILAVVLILSAICSTMRR